MRASRVRGSTAGVRVKRSKLSRLMIRNMASDAKKPAIDESLVLQLLDKEAEESQKIARTIERIQDVLTSVERDKENLKDENDYLKVALEKHKEKVGKLIKENNSLIIEYDHVLTQVDALNTKTATLQREKDELQSKNDELRYTYEHKYKADSLAIDGKMKELQETVETLTRGKQMLTEKISGMIAVRSSSDNLQGSTNSQLLEIGWKYKQLIDENDKLRHRLETLFREKSSLSELLEARVNELEDVKREFRCEVERLTIEHASIIKDLNNEIRKEREKLASHENNTDGGFLTVESNLGNLIFEDHDESMHGFILHKQSVRDILKRGNILQSELEDYGFVHSGRNLALPNHNDQLSQDICYLEEIEVKDREIAKLRDQITQLKEQIANEQKVDPRREEEVRQLNLDLKHECETFTMMKEMADKERSYNEKSFKEMEERLIISMVQYQHELARKEEEALELYKTIKLLKYQIKLYEDQINVYNSGVAKPL